MARARPPSLSENQISILRVLWTRGEASVAEVQADLEAERAFASTTVATMLSRLHDKGVVKRRTEGRQFVYRAAVREADVKRSMVSELMERLFEGDASALVSHLVAEGEIDKDELSAIRRRIARRKRAAERRRDA